jgi:WD40 repeat protein
MEIGDCVLLLVGHGGGITDLAAAADGRLLVSASADGTARAWELEKGQCTAILHGAHLRLS